MAEQRDALTELVRQQVGAGRRWSTRDFAERAVDPETGWSPGKSLVAKIIGGHGYQVTPRLVSALAVGLDLRREIVAAAAHWQVIGYREEEMSGGAPASLVRWLDSSGEAPLARAVAERWGSEESTSGS